MNAQPAIGPTTGGLSDAAVEREARRAHARAKLAAIDLQRGIIELADRGYSQHQIAASLGITQPRVHRVLRSAEARDRAATVTPDELILRAFVDRTSRLQLVKALSDFTYTFSTMANDGTDAVIPGNWTQVQAANLGGLLSDSEYSRIHTAVNPPAYV